MKHVLLNDGDRVSLPLHTAVSYPRHFGYVWKTKFSPNSELCATLGYDAVIRIFRLVKEDGRDVSPPLHLTSEMVSQYPFQDMSILSSLFEFSPDSNWLVFRQNESSAFAWIAAKQ